MAGDELDECQVNEIKRRKAEMSFLSVAMEENPQAREMILLSQQFHVADFSKLDQDFAGECLSEVIQPPSVNVTPPVSRNSLKVDVLPVNSGGAKETQAKTPILPDDALDSAKQDTIETGKQFISNPSHASIVPRNTVPNFCKHIILETEQKQVSSSTMKQNKSRPGQSKPDASDRLDSKMSANKECKVNHSSTAYIKAPTNSVQKTKITQNNHSLVQFKKPPLSPASSKASVNKDSVGNHLTTAKVKARTNVLLQPHSIFEYQPNGPPRLTATQYAILCERMAAEHRTAAAQNDSRSEREASEKKALLLNSKSKLDKQNRPSPIQSDNSTSKTIDSNMLADKHCKVNPSSKDELKTSTKIIPANKQNKPPPLNRSERNARWRESVVKREKAFLAKLNAKRAQLNLPKIATISLPRPSRKKWRFQCTSLHLE